MIKGLKLLLKPCSVFRQRIFCFSNFLATESLSEWCVSHFGHAAFPGDFPRALILQELVFILAAPWNMSMWEKRGVGICGALAGLETIWICNNFQVSNTDLSMLESLLLPPQQEGRHLSNLRFLFSYFSLSVLIDMLIWNRNSYCAFLFFPSVSLCCAGLSLVWSNRCKIVHPARQILFVCRIRAKSQTLLFSQDSYSRRKNDISICSNLCYASMALFWDLRALSLCICGMLEVARFGMKGGAGVVVCSKGACRYVVTVGLLKDLK